MSDVALDIVGKLALLCSALAVVGIPFKAVHLYRKGQHRRFALLGVILWGVGYEILFCALAILLVNALDLADTQGCLPVSILAIFFIAAFLCVALGMAMTSSRAR